MKLFTMMALTSLTLAGCQSASFLQMRTDPTRAQLGDEVYPVAPVVNPDPRGADGGVVVSDEKPGTWTFTLPASVSQVEIKTEAYDRFSLYHGDGPAQTPFVTITVTRDRTSLAESDANEYKVASQRTYPLNGNIAQEWTGQTSAGAGFCELIIRQAGPEGEKGSVCHAVALARDEEEQKVALGILGSIVWKGE